MIVVAGPIASGKTGAFRRLAQADIDSFNVDDHAAQLNHGSYQQLPPDVVSQATRECERFIHEHIAEGASFLVETTLRTRVALEQAALARQAGGFETLMTFVATDDPEINVERANARRLGGGRDMTDATVRDCYAKSLANLPRAMKEFDQVEVYDNSTRLGDAALQLRTEQGRIVEVAEELHEWVVKACRGTEFEQALDTARHCR